MENTFFNEFGTAVGTAATGQSWEIDESKYSFGDILDNVFARSLDTTNAIPQGTEDDVSMAMGWDFTLAANQTATISLILSDIMPTAGFYLSQTDLETGPNYDQEYSIYFSSTLDIQGSGGGGGGTEPVPEPSTLLLMGIGLMGILGVQRKRASRKKV